MNSSFVLLCNLISAVLLLSTMHDNAMEKLVSFCLHYFPLFVHPPFSVSIETAAIMDFK
jgi:hypothetical protein